MSTSVVVVTHKPERYLDRSLASVAEEADELVVVDNASEGDTAARICERYGARYLRMSSNLGFPTGVNAGVEAAASDHVALLNDDAFAEPGWLRGSVEALRDLSVAAVAPKILFAWKRGLVRLNDPISFKGSDPSPRGRHVTSVQAGGVDVTHRTNVVGQIGGGSGFWTTGAALLEVPLVDGSEEVEVNGEAVDIDTTFDMVNNAGSFLHPGGFCGDIGFGERDNGAADGPADRFAACGAAMVIRRETWESVGRFADDFFAYYEDVDWSWRAQLAGLRVLYDPSLVVRHVHGQTAGPGTSMFGFYVARNRLLCVARNAPSRVAARVLTRLPPLPPWSRRSLARRMPSALAHRRRAMRSAARSPEEVWSR